MLSTHVEYGLKGENGWLRSGEDTFNDPTINPSLAGVNLANLAPHDFSSSVPDSEDTIFNLSTFKNIKGFGGLVLVDGSEEPIAGAVVQLLDKNGNLLETMVTDENGWYLSETVHKGKQTTYTLQLMADDDSVYASVDNIEVGKSVKFGEGNFLVPAGDVGDLEIVSALRVEEMATSHRHAGVELDEADLALALSDALAFWDERRDETATRFEFDDLSIGLADLGGAIVGLTDGLSITLDDDAAGYGWSIDPAEPIGKAIDLTSVVIHEVGHIYCFDHEVLGETINPGDAFVFD